MAHPDLDVDENFVERGAGEKPGWVPKPAKLSHSVSVRMTPGNLADQMWLGRTVRGLRLFSKVVGRIATLSEEHSKTLDLQRINMKSPDVWTFVDIVKREFPFMNAYEKAWPIFAIVREHRHTKRYGEHEGLVDWERKAPLSSAIGNPHRVLESASVRSPVRDVSRGATASAPSSTIRGGGAQGIAESPDTGSQDVLHTRNEGSHEPAAQAQRQSAPSSPAHTGEHGSTMTRASELRPRPSSTPRPANAVGLVHSKEEDVPEGGEKLIQVLAFLSGLCPEQTSLLPVLVSKGIVDGAALDGFAEFPSKRRKLLLNSWLREETITELQFEVLNEAFESMGAEARMG